MKTVAVIVVSSALERQREALRAAVGLGLRGDAVIVVLDAAPDATDPQVAKAIATLEQLRRPILRGLQVPEDADVVEVWT